MPLPTRSLLAGNLLGLPLHGLVEVLKAPEEQTPPVLSIPSLHFPFPNF
jgi:hypothetical protein